MRLTHMFMLCCVTLIFIGSVRADSLTTQWESSAFSFPESVFASSHHQWLYVSNTNAKNTGFISRVSKTGKIDQLKWIDGLGSPTGMGMHKNKLFVADGKVVHIIDVDSGKVMQSVTTDSVLMLNDVTVSESGRVFISDILAGKIFTIEQNELKLWYQNPQLPHPNGLLVHNNELIAVNLGSKLTQTPTSEEFGSAYRINLTDKSTTLINSSYKLGGLDGVVTLDGVFIISHFPAGEIYKVTDKERILLGTLETSSADIGIDEQQKMIFVPFLFKNKVAAFKVTTH